MLTRLMLLGVISTLCLLLSVTTVHADQHSGLCPSGYPRMVIYNGTGHCFMVGSQGPCGRMAVIASDPSNPNYGICRCKDYGSNNCFGRPLIPYGERCYFAFSQGPCRKGQWFVRSNQGRAECHKTPCPIIESQRDLLYSEFPASDFYFTMYGGNKCFKTGTQAFCNRDENVFLPWG